MSSRSDLALFVGPRDAGLALPAAYLAIPGLQVYEISSGFGGLSCVRCGAAFTQHCWVLYVNHRTHVIDCSNQPRVAS